MVELADLQARPGKVREAVAQPRARTLEDEQGDGGLGELGALHGEPGDDLPLGDRQIPKPSSSLAVQAPASPRRGRQAT